MMGFRLPDIVQQLGLLQTRSKPMYRACKFLAEIVPRFVKMKKSEPNNQAKIETQGLERASASRAQDRFGQKIRSLRQAPSGHGFSHQGTEDNGQFCRTVDDRLFYFSLAQRRLLDLEQRPFARLVKTLSGLGAVGLPLRA